MNDDLVLGYDFGTSAVKVVLFNKCGQRIGYASVNYPLLLPKTGWAEQRPDDWWQAMVKATREVLLSVGANSEKVVAIGLCAQMCATVPVDKNGSTLHNALIWLDTRSANIARKITTGRIKVSGYGLISLLDWLRLTNGAPNLAGKDPISKMLWLRDNRPSIWQKTHKLLDVKDYLLSRLCGNYTTTADCAHVTWLMDTRINKQAWSERLMRKVGIRRSLLPDIKYTADVVGHLTGKAANALGLPANTPVVGGAGDVVAYALGSGCLADGAVHIHCGTGGWIAAHLNRRAVDIFSSVATLCSAEKNRYLLVAAQETAGASVAWAAKTLSIIHHDEPDYLLFDQLAGQSEPGSGGTFFFPWMFGERVPVDDDKIRAGFMNMSLSTERSDLARAVLEGVALNTRWALRPVEKITGTTGNIRLMGGGAVSDLWCQIFADVLQRPIERVHQPDFGGCRGAAMAASVGVGWFDSLTDAASMVQVQQVFQPNKTLKMLYDNKFQAFVKNYRSTQGWYNHIN